MNIVYDVIFGYDCYYLVKIKHNKKKTWFKGCHDI